MLQAAIKAPQAPASPASPAPIAGQATGSNVVMPSQLLTPTDVQVLRNQRSELSDQIRSAQSRRGEIRQALKNATGVDRQGLEQQMNVLNGRIARLEQDIDEVGKQLASPQAIRAAGVQVPNNFPRSPRDRAFENMVPMVVVFTLFVLAPIAFSVSRFFWKSASRKPVAQDPEQAKRLERMEHAIDSIAIEVERVSEGQRFVTRILAEGQNAGALGARSQQAERLQAPR